MYVESMESDENYPFLLVSLRNSIVNFVNFLTCKQEKSTCSEGIAQEYYYWYMYLEES